jgi:hypothetical protein
MYSNYHAEHKGTGILVARTTNTKGAPLIIEVRDHDGHDCGEVCIFLGDQRLTDMIVAAINSAVEAHSKETSLCIA